MVHVHTSRYPTIKNRKNIRTIVDHGTQFRKFCNVNDHHTCFTTEV